MLCSNPYWTSRVVVRLGNGRGGFAGTQEVPIPSGTRGDLRVVLADFNNDGFVDVLAADSNNFYRRFGDGAGNFSGTNVVTVSGLVTSASAGDVNADGNMDFVPVKYGSGLPGSYQTYLNNSAALGTFTAGPPGTLTANATLGTLTDVSGDGILDLVVGSSINITTHTGNNSGNFALNAFTYTSAGIFNVAACDLDNDGDLDLLAACEADATVSTRFNGGNNAVPLATAAPLAVQRSHLAVLPNPARGSAQLVNAAATSARILDPLGRGVRDYPAIAGPIDLFGIAPGVYVVRCGIQTTRIVTE